MPGVGMFSGTPKTEWLDQPPGDARDMKLIEEFVYTDLAGRRWDAPSGSIVNGASIPAALWTTVGSPYTGCYRNASIVHDVACVRATNKAERKAADLMFYEACLAGGCETDQANDLYLGVRIGAWWSPPATRALRSLKSARELKREAIDSVKAYKAVRQKLGKRMASAKPAEIDKLIEATMKAQTQPATVTRRSKPDVKKSAKKPTKKKRR